MKINNTTGLVGFLLVLSALSVSTTAEAATPSPTTVEARLNRLSATIRERAEQLPGSIENPDFLARGWADGRNGSWVNGRVGGWGDGRGGSFVNTRPAWRNGWSDGGGFWNTRPSWRNGGGFVNRSGGGGFLNRR